MVALLLPLAEPVILLCNALDFRGSKLYSGIIWRND